MAALRGRAYPRSAVPNGSAVLVRWFPGQASVLDALDLDLHTSHLPLLSWPWRVASPGRTRTGAPAQVGQSGWRCQARNVVVQPWAKSISRVLPAYAGG